MITSGWTSGTEEYIPVFDEVELRIDRSRYTNECVKPQREFTPLGSHIVNLNL